MLIRPAVESDIPGLARVHVDTWRAAYRGIVPDSTLAGLSYERREERWRHNFQAHTDQNVLHVALDSSTVVGFAGGGPERGGISGYDAEVYALYVHPQNQRQGIGQRLVSSVCTELAGLGFASILIWVLRDNRAGRGFYEKIGGVFVAEQPIDIGGYELIEVAYGWPDINALIREKR